MAARVRRQDPQPVPAHGRVARLPAHALHDGRELRARGDALLRAPLRPRLDLPREPDHQLVPVPRDVALRPRARARGRRRHALDDPLSACRRRRLHRDRDGAAGDDPGRRRRRRASGRRALQAPGRSRGDRAVDGEPRAGDRRRARRARLRHRRAEDHARPRPDRLPDRPRPRPARAELHRPRRPRHRRRARRADAEGGRGEDPRLVQGARPAREARALPPQRRVLRALPFAHRAAHLAAVVVLDGGDQAAAARGAARTRGALPPGEPAPLRDRLARERAGLVHLAADLVGASAAGLVLPGRPHHRRGDGAELRAPSAAPPSSRARPTCSTRGSARRSGRSRRSAGPTRPTTSRTSIPATCRRPRARSSASGRTG